MTLEETGDRRWERLDKVRGEKREDSLDERLEETVEEKGGEAGEGRGDLLLRRRGHGVETSPPVLSLSRR